MAARVREVAAVNMALALAQAYGTDVPAAAGPAPTGAPWAAVLLLAVSLLLAARWRIPEGWA
jgi:hypothetical protein